MKKTAVLFLLALSLVTFGCTQDDIEIKDDVSNQVVSGSADNTENSVQADVSVFDGVAEIGEAELFLEEDIDKDVPMTSGEQENVAESKEPTVELLIIEPDEPVSIPEDTVHEEPTPPPYVAVDGIALTAYDVTLSIGYQTMPYVTMSPSNATNKGEIWTSSDTSVATVDNIGNIKGISAGNCTVTVTSTDNPAVFATVNVNVIPGTECTYIEGILIANKTYPLPKDYAPGWDPVASEALNVMFAAAKEEGLSLWVCSGYRSYIDQKIIYNGYVVRDGKEAADRYSARPGHSEHQTGLAFDINNTYSSFADTVEGKWLAENCYKYGFIIRYPKDKEHITGYMYEPWHIRYLGNEKAKEVYDSGLCLEEFLGITSVYSY